MRVTMKSVICSSSAVAPRRRRGQRERRSRCAVRLGGQVARAVEPELAHVRPLAVALVGAPRLAEVGVGPGHVEDVVDDLEEHAQLGCERTEAGEFR